MGLWQIYNGLGFVEWRFMWRSGSGVLCGLGVVHRCLWLAGYAAAVA